MGGQEADKQHESEIEKEVKDNRTALNEMMLDGTELNSQQTSILKSLIQDMGAMVTKYNKSTQVYDDAVAAIDGSPSSPGIASFALDEAYHDFLVKMGQELEFKARMTPKPPWADFLSKDSKSPSRRKSGMSSTGSKVS